MNTLWVFSTPFESLLQIKNSTNDKEAMTWVLALKDIMVYRGRQTFARKLYSNVVSATIRDTEEK